MVRLESGGEYMLADQFGLGFDVIYASIFSSYTELILFTMELRIRLILQRTDVTNTNRRLRVQLRFNYHFAVSNPNLDAYMGVGAGSNTRFRKNV